MAEAVRVTVAVLVAVTVVVRMAVSGWSGGALLIRMMIAVMMIAWVVTVVMGVAGI
jgi:hypothetical protein